MNCSDCTSYMSSKQKFVEMEGYKECDNIACKVQLKERDNTKCGNTFMMKKFM